MLCCSEKHQFRLYCSSMVSDYNDIDENPLLEPQLDEKASSAFDTDIEKAGSKQSNRNGKRGKSVLAIPTFILFVCLSIYSFFRYTSCGSSHLHASSEDLTLNETTSAYLNVLKHSNLAGTWLKKYTAEQHLAGKNLELVDFTAEKFEEYGFSSSVEPFEVYLNYPTAHSLKLLKKNIGGNYKVVYEPTLVEDVLEEDPTTGGDDLVPAFHGYSANGNVTAKIVFANYGTKGDFDLLKKNNVKVEGNIVIVRYGSIFRGLKIKFAQEAGAVGVIIYSDPSDDYVPSDVEPYPKGPGRNPSSIQRGSVQFLSSLPGDPTRFSDKSEEALKNLTTIPHIPSLPISYKEAQPILKELNGYGLDLGFKGGIDGFKYTTGPSSAKLNLYNDNDYGFHDIYNVYGFHEGEDTNRVILLGNHRDSWIKGGAGDPNSGSAALLEIARGLNELFKLGWKPKYSILLASWDGEEYGLLGSTAYGEKYADVLGKEVVAYINLDAAVTGSHLNLQSSPLLNNFLLDIADQVEHPKSNKSLKDAFLGERNIEILGSGSDYTVFFEHLGITSFDVGFTTGKGDPVYHYHSNYDSYHWTSTFADPDFLLHNALAQYIGLITINLADTKVLTAFKAEDYALAIKGYFQELVDKLPEEWVAHKNETIPLVHEIKKTKKAIYRFIGRSIGLDKYAARLQIAWDEDVSKSKNPIKKFFFNRKVNALNAKLKDLEKNFLYEGGLNGREWFKHVVFASGRYTGYAGQVLPGLTEAIEDSDLKEAVRWIKIIRGSIQDAFHSYGN